MLKKTVSDIVQYTPGILDDFNLDGQALESALQFFAMHKALFACNLMASLEGVRIGLPDFENVLRGKSVCVASLRDMLKARAFGRAFDILCGKLANGMFDADRCCLIDLHAAVASDIPESRMGYSFRMTDVALKGVEWKPPNAGDVRYYWPQVLARVRDNERAYENVLVAFLQLSRTQFFSDGNKRAAMLFANGILLSNSLMPFVIPASQAAAFSRILSEFYETGNADEALRFFAETSVITPERCAELEEGCLFANLRSKSLWDRYDFTL